MKLIPLGKSGFFAKVDDSDFKWLCQWRWYCAGSRGIYAVRKQWIPATEESKGRLITIMMHRQILNVTGPECVDHINGDRFDNRKSNLRRCTQAENCWNAGMRKTNTSGAIGVFKVRSRFRAIIDSNGRRRHLGYFDTLEEACAARNEAVLAERGEFGRLSAINN